MISCSEILYCNFHKIYIIFVQYFIMEQATKEDVMEVMMKLVRLQTDMNYIKEYLADVNLSEEDILAIEEYEQDKKNGRLVSQEKLEKELGI